MPLEVSQLQLQLLLLLVQFTLISQGVLVGDLGFGDLVALWEGGRISLIKQLLVAGQLVLQRLQARFRLA